MKSESIQENSNLEERIHSPVKNQNKSNNLISKGYGDLISNGDLISKIEYDISEYDRELEKLSENPFNKLRNTINEKNRKKEVTNYDILKEIGRKITKGVLFGIPYVSYKISEGVFLAPTFVRKHEDSDAFGDGTPFFYGFHIPIYFVGTLFSLANDFPLDIINLYLASNLASGVFEIGRAAYSGTKKSLEKKSRKSNEESMIYIN